VDTETFKGTFHSLLLLTLRGKQIDILTQWDKIIGTPYDCDRPQRAWTAAPKKTTGGGVPNKTRRFLVERRINVFVAIRRTHLFASVRPSAAGRRWGRSHLVIELSRCDRWCVGVYWLASQTLKPSLTWHGPPLINTFTTHTHTRENKRRDGLRWRTRERIPFALLSIMICKEEETKTRSKEEDCCIDVGPRTLRS